MHLMALLRSRLEIVPPPALGVPGHHDLVVGLAMGLYRRNRHGHHRQGPEHQAVDHGVYHCGQDDGLARLRLRMPLSSVKGVEPNLLATFLQGTVGSATNVNATLHNRGANLEDEEHNVHEQHEVNVGPSLAEKGRDVPAALAGCLLAAKQELKTQCGGVLWTPVLWGL